MMSVWSLKLGSSKLRRSSVAELVLVTYTCFSGTWREPYFLLDYFVSAQAYGAFFRIISDCSSQYCYPADVGEKVHRVNQIRWRDFNSSSSAPSTPPLPLFIAPFFFFFFFLRHCRFFPGSSVPSFGSSFRTRPSRIPSRLLTLSLPVSRVRHCSAEAHRMAAQDRETLPDV